MKNLGFKLLNIVKFYVYAQCSSFFWCIGSPVGILGQNSTSFWKTFTLRRFYNIFLTVHLHLFICQGSEHWNSYWYVMRSKKQKKCLWLRRTAVDRAHSYKPPNTDTDMIHIAGHAALFHLRLRLKLQWYFCSLVAAADTADKHLHRQRRPTTWKSAPILTEWEVKNAASSWYENMWKLCAS